MRITRPGYHQSGHPSPVNWTSLSCHCVLVQACLLQLPGVTVHQTASLLSKGGTPKRCENTTQGIYCGPGIHLDQLTASLRSIFCRPCKGKAPSVLHMYSARLAHELLPPSWMFSHTSCETQTSTYSIRHSTQWVSQMRQLLPSQITAVGKNAPSSLLCSIFLYRI